METSISIQIYCTLYADQVISHFPHYRSFQLTPVASVTEQEAFCT